VLLEGLLPESVLCGAFRLWGEHRIRRSQTEISTSRSFFDRTKRLMADGHEKQVHYIASKGHRAFMPDAVVVAAFNYLVA